MRVFLDTNVIAYRFDDAFPEKQARARELLLTPGMSFQISTQVLSELASVLVTKLRRSRPAARKIVDAVDLPALPTDRALVTRALELTDRHDIHIYDALIVEAAVAAGCEELWTEDLSTGATLRGVRIVNPFADQAD